MSDDSGSFLKYIIREKYLPKLKLKQHFTAACRKRASTTKNYVTMALYWILLTPYHITGRIHVSVTWWAMRSHVSIQRGGFGEDISGSQYTLVTRTRYKNLTPHCLVDVFSLYRLVIHRESWADTSSIAVHNFTVWTVYRSRRRTPRRAFRTALFYISRKILSKSMLMPLECVLTRVVVRLQWWYGYMFMD
jgi:hypothetical protein